MDWRSGSQFPEDTRYFHLPLSQVPVQYLGSPVSSITSVVTLPYPGTVSLTRLVSTVFSLFIIYLQWFTILVTASTKSLLFHPV